MDLTIEVMLCPRGAPDFTEGEFHGRYRQLAIVAVYPRKFSAEVGMQRTGYIHVTGVPFPARWTGLSTEEIMRRVNGKLCAPERQDEPENQGERRRWVARVSDIPAGARNTLRTQRQIEVTWPQFKAAMRNWFTQEPLIDAEIDD